MTKEDLVTRLTEQWAPSAAKFGATATFRIGRGYVLSADSLEDNVILIQIRHPIAGDGPEQGFSDEAAEQLLRRSPDHIDALVALNLRHIIASNRAAIRVRAGLSPEEDLP